MKKRNNGDYIWHLSDECEYIDELATSKYIPEDRTRPVVILRRYIENAKKRIKLNTFGGLDGHKAVKHAETWLAKLN